MLQKIRGIVLHSFRLKDNQLVSTVYTERDGCLQFVMTIPAQRSGGRRRLVPALLQTPLALVEIEADVKPHATFLRVRDARCYQPLMSVAATPAKTAIALFLQEFLYHALRREASPTPALYAYLQNALQWLDGAPDGYANFHLVLMMRLSVFLGIEPNLSGYTPSCCFDLAGGCFAPWKAGVSSLVLEPSEAAHLIGLMRMNLTNMSLFKLSREQRKRLLEGINTYYRLHLSGFPTLKSAAILHEVLGG